jgi:hypothetical protein
MLRSSPYGLLTSGPTASTKDTTTAEGVSTVTARVPQFSPGQQVAALVVIEQCAWGDMDGAICDTETALRLAMDATRAEFLRWEKVRTRRLVLVPSRTPARAPLRPGDSATLRCRARRAFPAGARRR